MAAITSMYDSLRSWLFRLDPEQAHHWTLQILRFVGAVPVLQRLVYRQFAWSEATPVQAFGLTFPNPVGLAAGYDKDGLAWRGLAALGFGHVEVGTVTPRAQSGNPRPRLFRLPEDQGLINRLGFPGEGSAVVAARLGDERPHGVVLGVNLGMNKDTPLDRAAEDYEKLIIRFAPLADYLVVNVSSPNTIGLRRLQAREALDALLAGLRGQLAGISAQLERDIPLLVKLSRTWKMMSCGMRWTSFNNISWLVWWPPTRPSPALRSVPRMPERPGDSAGRRFQN